MKVVSAEEMRSIDSRTIENYGIAGTVLMERAGHAVAAKVRDLFGRKKVVVLSGGGNNGGDGIVAARHLYDWGWNVRVFLLLKEDRLSPDCIIQYRTARKTGVPIEFRSRIDGADLHGAVVVDAILGTGINKPVGPPISDLIVFLNRSGAPVVSVDMPSGISSDTGEVMGEAVRAGWTVTFGLPKIGHFLYPGAEYTGILTVEDIGFPPELISSDTLKVETIGRERAASLIPIRSNLSHKGDYGHILVIAGSRGKTGASLLTARACLRAGAGMVTIGVPSELADIFQSRVTEEMVMPLAGDGKGGIGADALDDILEFTSKKADILAIGPGLGVTDDTERLVSGLVGMSAAPLVIDADGINALRGGRRILSHAKSPLILTPHPGEMSRLIGCRIEERDRIRLSSSFAKETGVYLVLKGLPSVVADPDGRVFINTTGNPGMATAGSGDVLTGIIAAQLGQGLHPRDAAVFGTYLHGFSGDIGASIKGHHSLIASDLIDSLPQAYSELLTSS